MLQSLLRRGSLIAMAGLLLVAYVGLGVSAVLAQPIVFVILLIGCVAIDLRVEREYPAIVALLRHAQFAITHRAVVQVFLMLLLVAITDANRSMDRVELVFVTAIALLVPGGRIVYMGLLTIFRRRALQPVEVRNLPLPPEYQAAELPRLLSHNVSRKMMVLSVPPIAMGALAVLFDTFWLFFLVSVLFVLVVAAASLVVVRELTRLSHRPDVPDVLDYVSRQLDEYAPEVVLYFSGDSKAVYQVDMWLRTLEKMRRRTAVIARGRHVTSGLAKTSLPLVVIPNQTHLMEFPLPHTWIAMYVANVGNNLHFLREPRVKHVFIGHGDSDKVASFNPFSKVYDEIWVAGPAGRERYHRARVGVRDEQIVETGLPPLDELERRPGHVPEPTAERPLTVLYTPTWEGWNDDDFQTSLTEMGPVLVEKLLASEVPIRVIYKPHPLTGTRSARAVAADRRIRQLLTEAQLTQPEPSAQTMARLSDLESRLGAAELSISEELELVQRWHELFFEANAGRHLVVTGKQPRLYELYNAADLMIADISAVVSDFMATGKPYVVANPKHVPDEEYREQFPTTRGAYLLHPGCDDLDEILGAILTDDPIAATRAAERAYLHGPDEPSAQQRWDAAVDALIARAAEDWDGEHGTGQITAPPDEEAEQAISPTVFGTVADDQMGSEDDEIVGDPAAGGDIDIAAGSAEISEVADADTGRKPRAGGFGGG